MIVFACQQCGKRFGRPVATAGSVLFCECGARNVVPWESTLPESELPPQAAPEQRLPSAPAGGPIPQAPWRPWGAAERVLRQRNPSYCFNHQDTPPQHSCAECGEKFCADCVVVLQGRAMCGPCKNFLMHGRQRPPRVSIMAVFAPIIALVAGPGAIFCIIMAVAVAAEGRGKSVNVGAMLAAVAIVLLLALLVQLLAFLLGAISLRHQESDPRVAGRSLAVTGMVAALVSGILAADWAVIMLHAVQ
jgi:predicted  nucleic acid-binding Zn-ribbon protein